MVEWLRNVAMIATPLIAIAALIVSIWASRRVARKREFEILLERIDRQAANRDERFDRQAANRDERFDREAERREAAIRALIDRSDSKFDALMARSDSKFDALMARSDSRFDALMARSDELSRQSAEVTQRVARSEAILETVQADRGRASAKSAAGSGESEAIAAQGVAGGRPPK